MSILDCNIDFDLESYYKGKIVEYATDWCLNANRLSWLHNKPSKVIGNDIFLRYGIDKILLHPEEYYLLYINRMSITVTGPQRVIHLAIINKHDTAELRSALSNGWSFIDYVRHDNDNEYIRVTINHILGL